MKIRSLALLALVSAVSLSPFAPLPAHAQKGATAQKAQASPEAVKILNRYIQVTGGAAAYAKVKTQQMTGKLELKAMGLSGAVTILTKEPNKFFMSQSIGGAGETKVAFDGKTGWSKDPLGTFRILKGKELVEARLQADTSATVKWEKLYRKIELKGKEAVNGSPAYKLVLTPKSGNTITQYYDVASGLLVRTDTVAVSPQGTFPTETYLTDYRVVDGVKIPFLTRIKLAAYEVTMTISSVKNNLAIPDSKFAPQK